VAQDAGGLMREWVTELTKTIFSDFALLFRRMNIEGDFNYFINPKAKLIHSDIYKDYFRFAGQVVAKALFEKIPISIKLNPILLKALVAKRDYEKSIGLEDLKYYD
jgi:hypothetical protein